MLGRSVLEWPTGVTVYKPEKCYGGYTVVTPYRSELTFLIDMLGRVVHVWHADPERIGQSWFMRRIESGNWMNLVYYVPRDIPPSVANGIALESGIEFQTAVLEHDWDGNVVWRYTIPKGMDANHDMVRLQNGNTIIRMERRLIVPEVSDKVIGDPIFCEVNPAGEIVWQWSTAEHIDEFGYSDECRQLIYERGGTALLANTCAALPGNALEQVDSRFAKGNILSSQRNLNLIYIVDKQSGKVVWTWGDEPGQLVGQHQPVMLANGNILIYDNGGQGGLPARVRFFTRLVEVDPLTKNIVWEYADQPYTFKPMCRFFASSWGSVQRLPNGNTFSLDTHNGRLFEITPYGEIVWEYVSPFAWGRGTNVVEPGMFRSYRYGYEEVPEVDPYFPNTDGHLGVEPCRMELPPGMGLPATDLP